MMVDEVLTTLHDWKFGGNTHICNGFMKDDDIIPQPSQILEALYDCKLENCFFFQWYAGETPVYIITS